MRKIYAFMAGVMLSMASFQAMAQTNVTTKFIKNPSFEKQTDDWTCNNLQLQNNSSFTKKKGTYYLEKWTGQGNAVGSGSVTQTLTGLPAGKYQLTAASQNIQQGSPNDAQTGASIYAGATTNATTVTTPNDYTVDFETAGTDVAIGFRAVNASGNWICVDNFRLFYIAPDFTLLQTAITNAKAVITNAEKSSMAGIQPTAKANLNAAIEAAEALTAESSEEDLKNASFDLAEKQLIASENAAALKELKTAYNKARARLNYDMANSYLEALQTACDAAQAALALEDDVDIDAIMKQLDTAYANADASYQAKKTLKSAINAATRLDTDGKEGADAFAEAIAAAEAVRDSDTATPEEMEAAAAAMENATLLFRVQNGTGTPLNVKTLSAVQGATEIFARGSFSGGTAKEKGFCYSEEPEPTIFDARSTTSYSNNGDIYAMQGLKPATVYYVRAYAVSSGYQVSYGDVIKVPTRPMGNVTFSYGNEGDNETNKRIFAACEEAVWMWNNIGGIQHFHLYAHYKYGAGAGTGTAECSYGGYMSVSQNTGCQRTGTILHEGAHGLGMVPYTDWTNSIYRTNGDRGDWLGPRVDRVIQFLDNNSSAKLHGDNQHMWPYGINGSGEDTGSPILYRANALLVEALSEDGITHKDQGFLTPGYSFSQDDETKYYIKNEAENRGLATSYLCQTSVTAVRFKEMTADEVFSNDSCAWYITFNPSTCYYTFKNVATGRYLSMSTSSVTAVTNQSNGWYQLMGSRNQTSLDGFTFAGTSYWVINSNSHKAMNANAAGATAADFNHADDAVTQRWLFLTSDEVQRFAEARGETVGIRMPKAPSQAVATTLDIVAGQGIIAITANANGQDVNVFTIDGRRIEHVYVQSGSTAKVRVPRGIYLVGDRKVVVK